ncbi:NTP pyrophosphatase (non-canonical NTP hydrolase) [Flavobacterium sp. 90]|uniref:MazG nucleotide pyrophosphohydrolase domain-containing protein n=1 Tax=unclassified Flavobacterium TaxID=196869 RepID=UPI000EB06A1A|nr:MULTISPECIES: MazG nucleotide pyrophosphohydrolase domain-containing protein [unclassified Flavobacterium]RKR08800.1 NTP pyrophosphatase (non-canonical NTP hydrolase) [Flavobacterium sp. 81]TCK52587.1 NTP pyrophosphatase (non-canonical NTP hydrolase) [Flavobacterium sp. 90]
MDLKVITEKVVKVSDQYEKNCNIKRDEDWYLLKLHEEMGELTQNYLSYTLRGRNRNLTPEELKKNISNELADVLGQVLLFANYHNIDIEKAMEDKWFSYLKSSVDEESI